MTENTSAPTAGALPLFYRAPTLLRFADHARFGLRRGDDFRFAAAATAIPLVGAEFALAGRHYPIVFSNDASAMPLAVTGVALGRNLFVTEDGAWASGRYIPSYVRRYPFISVTVNGADAAMLGIDADSERISTDAAKETADPLFDEDGQATPSSRAAITLCDAYAVQHDRTAAFAQALKASGLLVERSAQMTYTQAEPARVQGFQLVDERAFRALSASTLVEFHTEGWLDLIVLHLASQASWQILLETSTPPRQ